MCVSCVEEKSVVRFKFQVNWKQWNVRSNKPRKKLLANSMSIHAMSIHASDSASATSCQEKTRHLGKGSRNMSNRVALLHHGSNEIVMERDCLVLSLLKALRQFLVSLCVCIYTWWPLTTLSFDKYDRSPAIDINLIMLWLALRNKFSLLNAGLN